MNSSRESLQPKRTFSSELPNIFHFITRSLTHIVSVHFVMAHPRHRLSSSDARGGDLVLRTYSCRAAWKPASRLELSSSSLPWPGRDEDGPSARAGALQSVQRLLSSPLLEHRGARHCSRQQHQVAPRKHTGRMIGFLSALPAEAHPLSPSTARDVPRKGS